MQAAPGGSSIAMPAVGIVVGLVLVVIGQFFLDGLADGSDTWHWIQHRVLFVGGLSIGWAATMLWATGRRA
jgi:hypothetical protein